MSRLVVAVVVVVAGSVFVVGYHPDADASDSAAVAAVALDQSVALPITNYGRLELYAETERGVGVVNGSASTAVSGNSKVTVGVNVGQGLTEVFVGPHAKSFDRVTTVIGEWAIRMVSFDGRYVVLAEPFAGSESIYAPGGREQTELVIVNLLNGERRDVVQPGNVEPEAMTSDGMGLYVIDHLPAESPEFYRVAYINIRTGERGEVLGPDKQPLDEDMQGTGRDQVYNPNGSMLYTVYTRQNVAAGDDGHSHDHVAGFVHVLALDARFAVCVDLPSGFGQGADARIAIEPTGDRLFVIDPTVDQMAVIDVRGELGATMPTETWDVPDLAPEEPVLVGFSTQHLAIGQSATLHVLDLFSGALLDSSTLKSPLIGLRPVGYGWEVATADGLIGVVTFN